MLYLLDADTLISADSTYFKRKRFKTFWEWLLFQGKAGLVKIPPEQFDEITFGTGDLVDWLKTEDVKSALLLADEVDGELAAKITMEGYAPDLNEAQLIEVGKDPLLIAHGLKDAANRTVVTFEVSAPSKMRQNRKIPDVCAQFGVKCINLHGLIEELDFTDDWQPPAD